MRRINDETLRELREIEAKEDRPARRQINAETLREMLEVEERAGERPA